jgi:hypothetical protein
MKELRYTLTTDGSSDVALLPILTWLLKTNGVSYAIQAEWADLRQSRQSKKRKLTHRIRMSIDLYPCDLLFIHRDAEREPRAKRVGEITEAVKKVVESYSVPPVVCVVPVRMQEAWLLFDEAAIRYAAGNRSSKQPLELPPLRQLEQLPDPKAVLHECLKQASGFRGRRLKRFRVHERAPRVSEIIDDFSPLRVLSAFAALEKDVVEIIGQQGWNC